MDVRIGLDYIVENREYVEKLGTALDTANTTVKKQVFELLSALCAYSTEGYDRALETLEHYKVRAPSSTATTDSCFSSFATCFNACSSTRCRLSIPFAFVFCANSYSLSHRTLTCGSCRARNRIARQSKLFLFSTPFRPLLNSIL